MPATCLSPARPDPCRMMTFGISATMRRSADQGDSKIVSIVSPSAPAIVAQAPTTLPPKAQLPNVPRQLSDAEFVMLRGAGPSRRVAAGEMLFRKGEVGRNMYVIESGEV